MQDKFKNDVQGSATQRLPKTNFTSEDHEKTAYTARSNYYEDNKDEPQSMQVNELNSFIVQKNRLRNRNKIETLKNTEMRTSDKSDEISFSLEEQLALGIEKLG